MQIVGCSSDNLAANAQFAKDNHFDFPLLSDMHLQVASSYGAADPSGKKARRVAALIDEQGKVLKIYDPAGTTHFPAKVLADIKKDEL